ncbi:phosphoribosylformylglycinamidine synthase subunit PurL [Candidatus Pelagibacter communis]|jgi:phosphoribosylformylglycinamidine synthase|uniref:Phosphoribosylformylglycinamidine synthase subunit PurL n=2 Tax=Pelagibacter ubique TaxID=198252 RepID=PURL_PELUB|nr:phosphoribosylformylglycinamidine synthase subunit PurL [Candidatus Pelagibacter ubique]Q4FLJ4.1 RecName: Full=Phosphoribosylformylglycinamidine synthase subunit PurL; Short=FGAM synthase; AltName: Full=Formylglycinamide ribonucleotide amidotransferase subunit II; Short=FGAR amidotransferase II; Short=FGAR-AT II; AltName: Full=Glutamine amidotransferase PurL; AltName: Full=Phosphoribosylformylglycinamidine synthase subunit II [Candidatus Pelagibacter ubique HTCC1062]AAZ21944.1 Phosphoribosylfo
MIVNEQLAIDHGLKKDEYKKICDLLKRVPNITELGIFSAMWNEHCSYKSSRFHLKNLPTKGKNVIQGPGENAGVIDIGDDDAIVFKIESHNHPSFIEPYQGAATGVGGIMRDVFTMGARPIANLNSIHFGSPQHKKTKNLLRGVVHGIGGYGNCMGVPTIAGQTSFDESYNGNILVNAMTLGHVKKDKIFYSKAAGLGKPVIYVGSKTGRDGIHGASMASASFDDKIEEKKPTVQVGDPFTEKLLLEACLELMAGDSIIAIQDMGAAGLTSSSIEMASKGNLGIEINLSKVPCREANMSPYEIMLSESQERMLIVLENGKEEMAKKIFDKWNLDFAVIGQTTKSKKIELYFNEEKVADIPVNTLVENSPMYDRKWKKAKLPKRIKVDKEQFKTLKVKNVLNKILSNPNVCSKEWIWQQYDHTVMGDTIQKPGGDAGVVRVHGTNKAVAASVDSSAVYCWAHPLSGGKQIVCESWRNLISVGAKPIAITNCLNFGSPENEENMGEFVECVQGLGEASAYLEFPVVSGNVSFYNQTKDIGIKPTPAIGGVGLIKDYQNMVTMDLKEADNILLVIGKTEGHLDQSLFARDILNEKNGPPPEINLFNEKNNGETILKLINKKFIKSAHDVSLGGIITALSKMCIKGKKGATLKKSNYLINQFEYLFGEDQGRYIIEISKDDLENATKILQENSVHFDELGLVNEDGLIIDDKTKVSIDDLIKSHTNWLTNYMEN